MSDKWQKEECSQKQPSAQKLNNKGDWAIRRNGEQQSDGTWTYDMKIVKENDKESYLTTLSAAKEPIEKAQQLLDGNDTVIMEALADTYEETSQNTIIMEALADIYEAILSMG